MSKQIVTADFKPDMHVVIKIDTRTGQMLIESGNGLPINPLVLASVCLGIAKANVDQTLKMQVQAATGSDKGKHPHQFLALEGEHRCRVPGCAKIKNDPIHVAVPVDNFPAGKCQGCGAEPHQGTCTKGAA